MTAWRFFVFTLFFFGLSQIGNTQKEEEYIPEFYYSDKTKNLKFNIFSLLTNSVIISYETVLTEESSSEMRLKLLGLPLNEAFNLVGWGIDIGYKTKLMYFLPKRDDFVYKHLMHGAYIKPLVGFHYINDFSSSLSTVHYRIFNIGVDGGKQWVYNNRFSLDMYVGYHFYGGTENNVRNNGIRSSSSDHFSAGDLYAHENMGFSLGLRIGILFDKYDRL